MNTDFASVSLGNQFIHDLRTGRFWRVCNACRAAELLGKVQARALADELRIRVPIDGLSTAGDIAIGESTITVSDGGGAPHPQIDVKDVFNRLRTRTRQFLIVDFVFYVGAIVIGFSTNGLSGAVSMAQTLAILAAGAWMSKAVSEFRRFPRRSMLRLLGASVAVVVATVAGARYAQNSWLTPANTAVLLCIVVVIGWIVDWVWARVAGRRLVQVPSSPTLSFAGGTGELLLHSSAGSLTGDEALGAIRLLSAQTIARLNPSEIGEVAELTRSLGSATALSDTLARLRPDDGESYAWDDLPGLAGSDRIHIGKRARQATFACARH